MSAVDYWPLPDFPFDDDNEQIPGQLPLDPEILAAFIADSTDDT